jgi:predicted porin
MFGSTYIFGGVGRRFVGDNEQFNLDDIWLLNVGAGYQVNKKFGVGMAYDYRESSTTAEDPSEATGYLTYKVTDSITTMLYGVAGFSESSPDASVGLQLSYKFEPF